MNVNFLNGEANLSLTESQEQSMIEAAAVAYSKAAADQVALATVYRIHGQPNANQLHGGLLTVRLQVSVRAALDMLMSGRIRYSCIGSKKGYRVSELAVREFLKDLQ